MDGVCCGDAPPTGTPNAVLADRMGATAGGADGWVHLAGAPNAGALVLLAKTVAPVGWEPNAPRAYGTAGHGEGGGGVPRAP